MLRRADGDSGCVERYARTATAARTHRLAGVRTVVSRCGSAFCLSQQAAPALPRIGRTFAKAEGFRAASAGRSFGGPAASAGAEPVAAQAAWARRPSASEAASAESEPLRRGRGATTGRGQAAAPAEATSRQSGVSTGSVGAGAGGVCTEPEGTVGVGVGVGVGAGVPTLATTAGWREAGRLHWLTLRRGRRRRRVWTRPGGRGRRDLRPCSGMRSSDGLARSR